ncbi:tyrosine-type recombinase/integrase [Candidatus Moduliflexota bacterium]
MKVEKDKKGKWRIDYSVVDAYTGRRRRIRERVDALTKTEAKAIMDKKMRDKEREAHGLENGRKPTLFFKLCEEYLQFSEANKKHQSWKQDKTFVKILKPYFGNIRIDRITTFQVEKFKRERKNTPNPKTGAPISEATVNRYLTCIKHMLTKAVEWGWLRQNPATPVKLFREGNRPFHVVTPEEEVRLMEAADSLPQFPYTRTVLTVALNTGLRRKSELLRMEWKDIDFERNLITVPDTKNGEIRHIDMNGPVRTALLSWREQAPQNEVFPTKDAKRAWERAREIADVPCRFHDLRHTFASRLIMAGVDVTTVKELMGHKDIKMTMRYTHLNADHKRNAVKALETYSQDGTNPARLPFAAVGGSDVTG